ncbi:GPI mannosyltransferase 2 [Zalerion maritima]|uniref:GPI mannosyltransferase 2 n=1 Tax=Zalerion maritima TaxID=339359 RepID=A0AAD5RTS5_9PEZI|nr:GPI mannosyltransferase 2 [Zalerion maritima]
MRVEDAIRQPLSAITVVFVSWKLLLFAIALGSAVGPAYDTSTTLLLPLGQGRFNDSPPSLVERLTRWDGIWFTGIATDGYSYEQSWAFGTGLPTAVSKLVRGVHSFSIYFDVDTYRRPSHVFLFPRDPHLPILSPQCAALFPSAGLHAVGWGNSGYLEPLLAIVIANASHFASVLVLYRLGLALASDATLALTASLLHVVSPAGLFLSAPYSESSYSLFSFVGYLLLAESYGQKGDGVFGDIFAILSGLSFGLATTFRSNGLLNGISLAADFVSLIPEILTSPTLRNVRRVVSLGVAGILVAAGFLAPQVLAYTVFCSDHSGIEIPPWCRKTIPSIYTYVQEHYWGVGFLRYWTPNNIGLFVLGAPMILVLIKSAVDVLRSPSATVPGINGASRKTFLPQTMAASQILVAGLSVTNYHVQIITRLASGYPLWYLWLAASLRDKSTAPTAQKLVVFLLMYSCIQGVLFASFLPPA